jgi:hypothetical protein
MSPDGDIIKEFQHPDEIPEIVELLPFANKLLNTNAATWNELSEALLPPNIKTVKRLGVMYEQQMLLCRDAKAYFPACVMSASMLEAFLLLLCLLNLAPVAATRRYIERAGKNPEDFEGTICRLGLDDFADISTELNWIPASLISEEWKVSMPEAYREIIELRHQNMSKANRDVHINSFNKNPAYSLMLLLNMMRNKMHPGRWIRQKNELQNEEAFSAWAQVAVVAAAHIRDCLLQQHQAALIEYCKQRMLSRLKIT